MSLENPINQSSENPINAIDNSYSDGNIGLISQDPKRQQVVRVAAEYTEFDESRAHAGQDVPKNKSLIVMSQEI